MTTVVFDRVSHRFGRTAALADVSLFCPAGAVTCLVGPNGAGKSTLLALAAGLLAPSAGRILAGDRVIGPLAPPRAMAYLPQESSFPPLLRAREIFDLAVAARRAGGAERERILAVTGIEPILDRRSGELSGGWLRRLGLAVALVPPVDVLLLDEPFVGLDPETLDRLLADLGRRAAEGATVVLASHEFEVVDLLAPSLAVLREGRVVTTAPAGDAAARDCYRRALGARLGSPPERRAHVG